MAQNNKSYKEMMELQGQSGGTATGGATSNQMLELILGRQPFQYDAQTDPAAQAVRKQTARNAKAVTRNTLGQHAAMTGGMPCTAAVSAAAQAGNAAMQEGVDRVAELERLAYQNYQTEGQNMYNAYGALQQQESDAFARQMQEQQWQYQQEQDQKADADAEYQKKLAMAQLKASYGDLSGLKELGIDTSKYTAAAAGGGSGGGGGYRRSSNPTPEGPSQDDESFNELLGMYPGMMLDSSQWAAAAAQYGESKLIAWGFKKKQSSPSTGSGGSSGGAGKATKPGLPGMQHPGVAKGESRLGTRD